MPSVLADLALNTTASPARRRIELPRGESGASFRQQFQELSTPKPAEPKRQESPASSDRAASRTTRRAEKPSKKSQDADDVERNSDDVDETAEHASANEKSDIDSPVAAEDDVAAGDDSTADDSADAEDSPTDKPVVAVVDPSAVAATVATAAPVTPAATAADGETTDVDIAAIDAEAVDASAAASTEDQMLSSTLGQSADDESAKVSADADGQPLLSAVRPTGKPTTGVSSLGAVATTNPDEVTASTDAGETSADPAASQSFAAQSTLSMMSDFAEVMSPAGATVDADAASTDTKTTDTTGATTPAMQAAIAGPQVKPSADAQASAAASEPAPVESQFAEVNHTKIVTGVRGALLPNGGRMELKLDPPELGSLQVSLHIKDGVVTASFQTQNPETARLLSHTLSDLRQSLEAQGVVVDKLHVQQAPKSDNAGSNTQNGDGRPTLSQEQQQENRREQQRKDMVQRLWDQLAGNAPIDVRA